MPLNQNVGAVTS